MRSVELRRLPTRPPKPFSQLSTAQRTPATASVNVSTSELESGLSAFRNYPTRLLTTCPHFVTFDFVSGRYRVLFAQSPFIYPYGKRLELPAKEAPAILLLDSHSLTDPAA